MRKYGIGGPCVAEKMPISELVLNVEQRSRRDGVDTWLDG
jgi:hypothetical protein